MSKQDIDKKYELVSFYENNRSSASANVRFNSCEICRSVDLDPSLGDLSRLLRVRIRLTNVCPGKEVSLAFIVTDRSGRVLAYQSETFIATREGGFRGEAGEDLILGDKNNCKCPPAGTCIDVTRVFTLVLPERDICSPLECNVRVIANYTSPDC